MDSPHSSNSDNFGTTGPLQVQILFSDPNIGELFSALLEVHGALPVLIRSIEEVSLSTHIVTEPRYFPALTPEQARQCLVVGPRSSLRGINALSLPQPLTQEAVESAIERFLAIPASL